MLVVDVSVAPFSYIVACVEAALSLNIGPFQKIIVSSSHVNTKR